MKKGLVLMLMCVAMLFAAAPSAFAQDPDKEYKETLSKMLTLSGALPAAEAMIPQIIGMMKQTAPSTPDSFWNEFITTWKSKFINKLVDGYAPIYKKYLTLSDLKQIVAFYESPVGKKLGAATPKMTTEGMQMGQQLGMEIATDLQKALDARGNK